MKKRNLAREQYWRDMHAQWDASKLSKSEFCRRHSLRLNAFCGWQRKIALRDMEPKTLTAQKRIGDRETTNAATGNIHPPHFVPVIVTGDGGTTSPDVSGDGIEIVVLKIKLPTACDSRKLITILEAMK